jgi:endonuclease G, mitochondrial
MNKLFGYIILCFCFHCFSSLPRDSDNSGIFNNAVWSGDCTSYNNEQATVYLELPRTNPSCQILSHLGYTLSFDTPRHIASWVAYSLTAEETVAVVERNNHFQPDPLLRNCSVSNADYQGSGYDRGHLAPSADMCYSYQTMVESFYLTNITPQVPGFNRGIWKKLEDQVRQWAVDERIVYVVTGPVLRNGLPTIGINNVPIPEYFYKVVLDYTNPEIKGIGFIIPNQGSQNPLQSFAVSIDSVEKVTGIDFFHQLPDEQENLVERKINLANWSWNSTASYSKKTSTSKSTQCKGTTKSGLRCKNMTLNLNGFCYLHQNQADGNIQQNISNPTATRRSVSVRCSATTQKGTQCSRMTYSPNGKCWQHGGD